MPIVITSFMFFIGILCCLLLMISNVQEAAITFFFMLVFILPGVPISRAIIGRENKKEPCLILFSAAIGLPLSSFIAVCSGLWIRWEVQIILFTILIVSGILFYISKNIKKGLIVLHPWSHEDFLILIFFNLLVLILLIYPFSNVGKLTDQGFAYASLFGHDFILRGSYVASISHSIPPDFFNFHGEKLPTYWLFYMLPAIIYKVSSYSLRLENIMLLTHVFCALLLTSVLFCLIKEIVKKRLVLFLTMFVALCAYSYMDFYLMFKAVAINISWLVPNLLKSYLYKYSGLSHGLFRVMLFEPHVAINLSLLIIIILIQIRRSNINGQIQRSIIVGMIMGLSLGVDAFTGAIITLWCGLIQSIMFIKGSKSVSNFIQMLVVPAMLSTIALCVYVSIDMYAITGNSSSLLVQLHKPVFIVLPFYLILEYGPLIIFALLGMFTVISGNQHSEFRVLILLFVITLFFVLFVRHNIEVNVGLRKGGYVLYIPLIIFAGIYLEQIFHLDFQRPWINKMALVLIFLASFTVITDHYISSDVSSQKRTTFVTPADREACEWIKKNTAFHSVVQCEPEYPGPYEYSLIACFAERAMVIGESKQAKLVPIPNIAQKAKERKADVQRLFKCNDLMESLQIIEKYKIDYIYVGENERFLYPEGIVKIENQTNFFKKVFDNGKVSLFKTLPRNALDNT